MAPSQLNLKVFMCDRKVCKTMALDPSLLVYDVCKAVRDKENPSSLNDPQFQDWGLFLSDDDPKKGIWLEAGRTLEYYLLRDGDTLEYRKKIRPLRVKMMDDSVKTILVDDSQPVSQLMIVICSRIGIANYEEYSLVRDFTSGPEDKYGTLGPGGTSNQTSTSPASAGLNGTDGPGPGSTYGTLRAGDTLRSKDKTLTRDQRKMEQLKRKLHTDDEINWVDHTKTLREQGIDDGETLLLRRKYFYSDQNIDSRDPVQLNLLYVQCRDAIVNGTHPVTLFQACQFAGIQCQIQFGNHDPLKHRMGFLDLNELIVKDFRKMKGLERKIYEEHKQCFGDNEIEAKVKYVKLARGLKTYGVTFFLVKEKMKGKNKLAPRLLGVTKESVLRLDEKTKEIIKTWQLTSVKRWAASPNSFTLDFGDYQDAYYSVQTPDGEQISRLLAGYIDIILKRKKAKERTGIEGDDESSLVEEIVSPHRATYVQLKRPVGQRHDQGPPQAGRVALTGTLGRAQPGSGSLGAVLVGPERGTGSAPRLGTESDPPLPAHATLTGRVKISGPAHPSRRARVIALARAQAEAGIQTLTGLSRGDRVEYRSHTDQKVSYLNHTSTDPTGQTLTITHCVGAINAASAEIVSLLAATGLNDTTDNLGEGDASYRLGDALKGAIGRVTNSLEDLMKDVFEISKAEKSRDTLAGDSSAGLELDEGTKASLLSAARDLAQATSDMLECLNSYDPDTIPMSDLPEQQWHQDHEAQILTARVLQNQERNLSAHLTKIGEAGARVLDILRANTETLQGEGQDSQEASGILLGLAKGVANAAACLVLRAKTVANSCASPGSSPQTETGPTQAGSGQKAQADKEWDRDRIVMAATRCAMRTSELVTCVKIMAPTMNTAVCRDQTVEAAKCVSLSVDHVLEAAQDVTTPDKLMSDLKTAATQVVQALDKLIEKVTEGVPTTCGVVSKCPDPSTGLNSRVWVLEEREEKAYKAIEDVTAKIVQFGVDHSDSDFKNNKAPVVDSSFMIQEARIVAQATSDLVAAIKCEAQRATVAEAGTERGGPIGIAGRQKSLFEAAKELAEATARLVETAKQFATGGSNARDGQNLTKAAEDLRIAARTAIDRISSHRVMTELQNAARESVESAATVIKDTEQFLENYSDQNNTDGMLPSAEHHLISHCKLVGERLAELMSGIEDCNSAVKLPDQHLAKTKGDSTYTSPGATLVHSCDRFLGPALKLTQLVSEGRTPLTPNKLGQSVDQLTRSLGQLKKSSDKAHQIYDARPSQIKPAHMADYFAEALEKIEASKNRILTLPQETHFGEGRMGSYGPMAKEDLVKEAKCVGTDMARFITAVVKNDEHATKTAVKGLAETLSRFADRVGVFMGPGLELQKNQISSELLSLRAGAILDKCVKAICESSSFPHRPHPLLQHNLSLCARDLSSCLNEFITALPQPQLNGAAESEPEKMALALAKVKEAQQAIQTAASTPDTGDNNFSNLPMQEKRRVFEQFQIKLQSRARDLNKATQVLLNASTCNSASTFPAPTLSDQSSTQKFNTDLVAAAAEQFSSTFHNFVQAGITVLSTKEPAERQKLVHGLEKISLVAGQLMSTAHQTTIAQRDPTVAELRIADDLRNRLVLAARSVTDAVNDLINCCISNELPPPPSNDLARDSNFGDTCHAECQSARQTLEVCRTFMANGPFTTYPKLNDRNQTNTSGKISPLSLSYHKITQDLSASARQIDADVEAMTHFARENILTDFGAALNSWAGNVSSFTEKVAQCGYVMSLVQEVSDPRPSDNGGREALASFLRSNSASSQAHLLKAPLQSVLNVTQLNEAADSIIQACSSIRDAPRGTSQQQILTAATVIAKHTSSLCNCCRLASSRTQDTELKQFFVRSAKDVANATSELVKRIKGMEGVGELSSTNSPIPSDNDKQSLTQALNPLTRAVKSLVDYAASNQRNSSGSSTSSEDILSNYNMCHESIQAQLPLIETGSIFLEEANAMVSSCQRLANDPKSVNFWHEFSRRAHNLSQHMSTIVTISRDLAPGQVNCDRTSRKLCDTLNDLEAITMEALNHGLRPNPSNTAKGFKDDAWECAAQLLPLVDGLRAAGKYEIGLIGLNLNKFDTSIASLVESYVGHVTHSCCMDSRKLISGLDRIKTVLESCQQLVSAVKDGAGDADVERSVHETIDESGEAVKESLRDLTRSLDADGSGRPVNSCLATGAEEDGLASGSDMSSSAASPRDDPFVRSLEGVRNGMIRLTHFDQAPDFEGEGDEVRAETRLTCGIHKARDISRNLARLAQYVAQGFPSSPNGSQPDPGAGLESSVTGIAQIFDQLIDSFLDPNEGIVPQLKILTPTYALCTQPSNAIYELPDRLRYATRQLGESCTEYMKFAGTLYHSLLTNPQIKGSSPTSSLPRRASPGQIDSKTATYLSHSIEEKINHVMHVLEAISQILPPDATKRNTERACSQAKVALNGLIGDLDTTVLFATTGSLKPDTDDYPPDLFTQHRDVILKTAKSLVEDTKTLVAGAASNPEQLAAAAQSAVRTITKLSEEVKLGAAALGSKDPEAQVLLINAIKDVASALGDLIQATKQASGKPLSDPAMTYLKESAKVMVTNVTSLLKTVKTVEDAKLRGTRALESTIQALTQELRVYEAYDAPLKPTSPDELHRAIYNVHCSASDICVATEACTQEEIISASNQSRRAVQDLLRACKGAAQYAEGEEGKANILDGGKCVAIKCRDMLDILHQIITIQHHESQHGNNVARLRGEMDRSFSDLNLILDRFTRLTNENLRVTTAQDGSACYYFSDCGSVYSNDTSSISGHHNMAPSNNMATENELLSAASAIEAAARNLAVLDPIIRPKQAPKSVTTKNIEYKLAEEDEMKQNFDGQILEAAKAIANATAALIRAASAAQRELVMQGKLSPDTLPRANGASRNRLDIYGKEGQWSYGLISAAKLVVAATHSMCQAANDLVKQKRHRLSQENELASSRSTGGGLEGNGICEGEDSNSNLVLTTCEERLVSSAKSVASSTAQLLVACKVKAGVHNPVTENLQRAGTAIKRATDQLVRAATRAIGRKRQCSKAALMLQQSDSQSLYAVPGEENEYDDSYSGPEDELSAVRYITIDKRMVGSLAQEMEAQQEILRKERELEEARVRLGVIRKAKYKDKNSQGQQFSNSNGFINDYQTTYGIESEIYNVPSTPNFKSPAYITNNTSEECNYSDF